MTQNLYNYYQMLRGKYTFKEIYQYVAHIYNYFYILLLRSGYLFPEVSRISYLIWLFMIISSISWISDFLIQNHIALHSSSYPCIPSILFKKKLNIYHFITVRLKNCNMCIPNELPIKHWQSARKMFNSWHTKSEIKQEQTVHKLQIATF